MARRLVLMVRHGQYDLAQGDEGGLTTVGEEQARHTAELLSGYDFDLAVASNLRRARETAAIFTGVTGLKFKSSALLQEGFPTKVPGRTLRGPLDRPRLDEAFDKYMKPGRKKRSVALLVCHGNVIRYFVCRALKIPASRWLSLGTNHGAVTRIVVQSDGRMGVASFNESSHFPSRLVT